MRIWKGEAIATIPDGYALSDAQEKRMLYRSTDAAPQVVVRNPQSGCVIQFSTAFTDEVPSDINELLNTYNYLFVRTVPGYELLYACSIEIDKVEFGVIQYWHYVGEEDAYATLCACVRNGELYVMNIICPMEYRLSAHDDFLEVIGSIKFCQSDDGFGK